MRILLGMIATALLFAGTANAQITEIQQCGDALCATPATGANGPFLDSIVQTTRFSTYLNQEAIVVDPLAPYCGFSGVTDFDPLELAKPPITDTSFMINGPYPGMTTFSSISPGSGVNADDRRSTFILDLHPSDGISATWNSLPGTAEIRQEWDLVDTSTAVQVVTIHNGLYSAQHREHCSNYFSAWDIGTLKVGYVAAASWVDTDSDSVPDQLDNCSTVANGASNLTNQWDSNLDGYGNACDADYNNDGFVDTTDFGIFLSSFQGAYDPDTDHDGDGITGTIDYGTFLSYFQGSGAVGNSGLSCAGTIPCSPLEL